MNGIDKNAGIGGGIGGDSSNSPSPTHIGATKLWAKSVKSFSDVKFKFPQIGLLAAFLLPALEVEEALPFRLLRLEEAVEDAGSVL